uniref:hypothetical protein n=1 Tax=Burkholderia diffusa TaxID=488732 RepID=UPI001CC431C3
LVGVRGDSGERDEGRDQQRSQQAQRRRESVDHGASDGEEWKSGRRASNHSGGRRRRGTSNDLNYAYRRVSGWQITRGANWKCRIAPTPSADPAADRCVQYFPDRAGMHERIAGQCTRACVLNSSMRSVRHIEKLNKKPSN